MEPPCGQSIVKCEKQKDDGRMETQKRKQNEKEKAERRMKIVAGLGSVDEYIPYVQEGADELFCGYVPYNWIKKYGTVLPLNRREVLAYNVQLGSFSELEILSAMIRKYRNLINRLQIKNYNVFRTDSIWTKPREVNNEPALPQREVKPRVLQDAGITVTVRQTYDLMIDDTFEVILPNYAKNIVILSEYILVVLDNLIGNICLFKRQKKDWSFVAVLESFPYQSLINRRLNHIFLEEDKITFVYNNRVRRYDLSTGEMITNQKVQDARSKEYLGKNITEKFIGKMAHRN